MIQFTSEDHKYTSIDKSDDTQWISVTKLIHHFKEPFDTEKMAVLCSKGKNPKYKGKTPEEIIKSWDDENLRAVTLGSWYHDQREKDLLSFNTITRDNRELEIINPLMDGVIKIAPSQSLTEGIYPEHLVFMKSVGICGQGDRVEVVGDFINLYDYKTNKEIKMCGFTDRQGNVKKMLPPLSHLDDCNFNDYALQLSTYMYIMLRHNYNLKPGKMQIDHVKFKINSIDEYGYPVVARDLAGDPIVDEVIPYNIPYMRDEVISMFKYVQQNREKILNNEH